MRSARVGKSERKQESKRRQANEKGKESDSLQARDLRDQRDESDAIFGTLRAFTGPGDERDAAGLGEAPTMPSL